MNDNLLRNIAMNDFAEAANLSQSQSRSFSKRRCLFSSNPEVIESQMGSSPEPLLRIRIPEALKKAQSPEMYSQSIREPASIAQVIEIHLSGVTMLVLTNQ
jgi:hypothetical protein